MKILNTSNYNALLNLIGLNFNKPVALVKLRVKFWIDLNDQLLHKEEIVSSEMKTGGQVNFVCSLQLMSI